MAIRLEAALSESFSLQSRCLGNLFSRTCREQMQTDLSAGSHTLPQLNYWLKLVYTMIKTNRPKVGTISSYPPRCIVLAEQIGHVDICKIVLTMSHFAVLQRKAEEARRERCQEPLVASCY